MVHSSSTIGMPSPFPGLFTRLFLLSPYRSYLPKCGRYNRPAGSDAVRYRGLVTTINTGAPALFRAVGLQPDGPSVLGRPLRVSGRGVYVVELPAPLPTAPIDLVRVG